MNKTRCKWANASPELTHYHDHEYGFRITNDIDYFERLILEIFQAGLSWATILKKRQAFRNAFDNFDFNLIAQYNEFKINSLLKDKAIIRNKRKIEATIYNAAEFKKIVEKYDGFDNFITSCPLDNKEEMLKIFKKKFKFMGPLILEEFLMSTGLWEVKHEKACFLYNTEHQII